MTPTFGMFRRSKEHPRKEGTRVIFVQEQAFPARETVRISIPFRGLSEESLEKNTRVCDAIDSSEKWVDKGWTNSQNQDFWWLDTTRVRGMVRWSRKMNHTCPIDAPTRTTGQRQRWMSLAWGRSPWGRGPRTSSWTTKRVDADCCTTYINKIEPFIGAKRFKQLLHSSNSVNSVTDFSSWINGTTTELGSRDRWEVVH